MVLALAGDIILSYLPSHPGGSRNIPSRFMPPEPEINAGVMSLARMQT